VTIGRRPGLRAVLASSGYRCLLAAQTVSRRGDTASAVALVVLVFQLTGSWLKVTGAVIAEVLPVLVPGPVAGAPSPGRGLRVFQLTGSGLKVTGAVIAEVLPVLVPGPVAGAPSPGRGLRGPRSACRPGRCSSARRPPQGRLSRHAEP